MSVPTGPRPRPHGRLVRALAAASASIALVVAASTAYGLAQYVAAGDAGATIDSFDPVDPDGAAGGEDPDPAAAPPTTRCAEEPCNYLILGSDSRAGLSPDELERFGTDDDIGGENRADTIMLVHLDPALEKAIILSFPRDLWVDIPGHGSDKINAAFEGGLKGGGATLMAKTVANLTGLRVDHVLYVDLAGFQGIVDTLGGVDLCIPAYNADPSTGRLQDPLTGLDIAPGCQRLGGEQALAYVRTRALPCDTIPDFARIGRQQQFLRAVINQVLRPEKLVEAPSLIRPILSNLDRDERFAVGDLIYLVGQLRGLTTGAAEFRSIPGSGGIENGLSVVKMDPSAQQIFDAIAAGKQISGVGETLLNTPPSEANVEVAAVDAGSAADAADVLAVLSQAGFAVGAEVRTPADIGLRGRAKSAIAFAPGRDAEAQIVRSYFPNLPTFEATALEGGGYDVAVITTADYAPPPPPGGDAPTPQCPPA